MEKYNFIIEEEYENQRIDVYLAQEFENISRSHIQDLIGKKKVFVNGKAVKSNYKLKSRDNVEFEIPDNEELKIEAENIPLDIVYEDRDIVVVNKAQGMVVHPAPGNYNGTLVNALLYHCKDLSGINGVLRPGIVHRIDKDTSGILVVAKNDAAHKNLANQLKEHSMNRVYRAVVEGIIKEDEGTVDKPLARHPVERVKIAVVKGGRNAVTHYKVLERYRNSTLIECKLETGRTHQIRVHMAYIGHALVGDPLYGYKKQRFNLEGQMLHAQKLGFIHPTKGKYMEFEREAPSHFQKIITILRNELK
ncbi:23S rRNA pseudouridine1911/1915/1917 synthase [Clostridium acetobutylicum]|uniref:Pseudouridine synthase n=1 Tax=Clostridium acetobutylicum (strain ATCC 824 / DSM 792 / JCM 1419 / IAM 19013 / LMG 5710 / NBRC 13948 / NRRL B-527 / VKM B-1787 / 2291 / W) TaxID=272562 RepID=Q97H99_CLOAB|nr:MULTISPECIES: RluA family pseudouridine synthase [Clostridium]AAK80072.1 Predicted pseudouridylate synthase, YLYB B.subtilis ortholog [Clostridium acetobutylicum ATCC 824]ADZ21165.1 pseudouridylate synthase [Clostridium acetobutylicum EA 2018]AEI32189.1 pseudouridylate synthase [Clostridium acetobutylicum DSM 1731]AWV79501.1 RluA family pseudouridine synthase [Clostridium acetobutylicum]MBC2394526.1 RluA family pseudouridine synthase [Clostridium acetobutylicum]